MSTPKTPRKKNNSPLKNLIQNKILDLKIPKERKLVFLLTKEIYIDEIANGTKKVEYRTQDLRKTNLKYTNLLFTNENLAEDDERMHLVICCHSFKKYVLFECDDIDIQSYVDEDGDLDNPNDVIAEDYEIQVSKVLDFGNF